MSVYFVHFSQKMRKMRDYLRQNYAKISPMKLPKPRKRGDAYHIKIMLNSKRKSATRDKIIMPTNINGHVKG